MTINCIIVEDEPIARDILIGYVRQVPYLKLVGSCADAFEAMDLLNKVDIDVIILDINMPHLSGIEMLRTLKKYPAVIITSAYPDFALEGYELSVTDYLLKPFSFARFVQATEKVLARGEDGQPATQKEEERFIMVRSDKKLAKIFLNEIVYVEAYGNYIFIHRGEDRVMSKQTLTNFETQLPPGKFVRIHKSYIVSVKAVKYLEGNEVSVGSRKLPVGKVYREAALKTFQ